MLIISLALGIGSCLVTQVLLLASIAIFRQYLWSQNKTRAATRAALAEDDSLENIEFMDLTDKENPHFVYIY
jgi:hypothetical protein